jgi:hypothetical protein
MTINEEENPTEICITGFAIADKRYDKGVYIVLRTYECCDAFTLAKSQSIGITLIDEMGKHIAYPGHWIKGHTIPKFYFRTKAQAQAALAPAAEAVRDLLREKGWMK